MKPDTPYAKYLDIQLGVARYRFPGVYDCFCQIVAFGKTVRAGEGFFVIAKSASLIMKPLLMKTFVFNAHGTEAKKLM